MSNNLNSTISEQATRRRRFAALPCDYNPAVGLESDVGDPVADVLARVYALILSWPATGGSESPDEGTGE